MGQSPIPRNAPAPAVALSELPAQLPNLLASALAGGAEILVSGDKDLPAVADDSPIPIIEPRAFWVLITGGTR